MKKTIPSPMESFFIELICLTMTVRGNVIRGACMVMKNNGQD